jgi:hypothetical protein
MKYEVVAHDRGVEAIGAYSGHRIRMVLRLSAVGPQPCVWVRGSESEAEVGVDVPLRPSSNRSEAFDHGYAHAVLWIDAENKRIP